MKQSKQSTDSSALSPPRVQAKKRTAEERKLAKALSEIQKYKKALEVPGDVLESLTQIHERGVGQVRGIAFDLNPSELLHKGWKSRSRIGLDMGGLNGPLLRFPWRDTLLEDFRHEVWTEICVGDEIFVKDVSDEMIGDELDHSSDQKAKVVTLAIRRGTEEIVLPDPVYFFEDTSFSSHWGISYTDAVRRVNEILGDERVRRTVRFGTLDFDVEVPKRPAKQQKEEWDFATRAHRAIDSANPAALLRGLNLNENDHDLKDKLDRFTSGAVSLGYWLAKAEFSQHAPDAHVGKNRRKVSKNWGEKTGAEKQRKADEAWRTFGLTTAIELRVTHRSWGQKRVAKEISKRLVEAGKKNLPDLDTVTRQISKWEHAGKLKRSTKNKNG